MVMKICIKPAETVEELDELFRERYKVYVEEERQMAPRQDGRISDRFDTHPFMRNFIALDNRHIIGGVRFIEATADGTPADEFFDFSTYIPPGISKIGSGSMLFIERSYREIPDLALSLMGVGFHWAYSREWSHIFGVVNPEAENFFLRAGFRSLASQLYDECKKLMFVPVILDMKGLNEKYLTFIEKQQNDLYWLIL